MKVFTRNSEITTIGYGEMGSQVNKALKKLGVVTDDPCAGNSLACLLPYHVDDKKQGQYLVCFTMFETNRLPEDFIEVLGNYDLILVPCEENRLLYGQHHPNVHVVPLGVDPDIWKPTKRKTPAHDYWTQSHPFTFLTGGNGGLRKGHKEACITYRDKVRPVLDEKGIPSRLIVKATPQEWQYRGSTGLKDLFESDGIVVIGEWLTKEDEVQLYADAHCYASFSKGEGWGLMPNQALAQGLPIICTDAAGQAAFAKYAYVVPYTMQEAIYGIWGPDVHDPDHDRCGKWWEPDLDAMANAMIDVATHYPLYESRAWVAAHSHDYYWENTAKGILKHLQDRPDVPDVDVKFDRALFKVVTTEDRTADIADKVYGFKKGVEYWVPADVKRILWNSRILHPSCVEENSGLLPNQVRDYEPMVAVCPTCARPLPLDS